MENTLPDTSSKTVTYAFLIRRITAFIADAFIALAVGVIIFFAFGNTVVSAARNEAGARQELTSLINDAGIVDSNGYAYAYEAVDADGNYGFAKYEDMVWKYYTSFIAKDERVDFLASDDFSGDKSNPVDVGKWVYAHVYGLDNETAINTDVQPYYAYTSPVDYTSKPVLNADIEARLATDKTAAATDIMNYWFDYKTNSYANGGKYAETFYHLQAQQYYLDHARELQVTTYLKTLPSFLAAPLIVYMVFPLFFKLGQTPAKLIMKLGVVNDQGYYAKKWQILVHGSLVSFMALMLALPIGIAFSILALGILALIDISAIRFLKKGQTFHEIISKTRVAEIRDSTFFHSYEEEMASAEGSAIRETEEANEEEPK